MSEDLVQQLRDFVEEKGRLPTINEPGLQPLIELAKKEFGSLENALMVSGLLTEDSSFPSTNEISTKKEKKSREPKIKATLNSYAENYFLEFLGLTSPTWWERKSRAQYSCSICGTSIVSGDRYIGKKILHPGRRGKYGYRGTYTTDYYHILCLLETSANDIKQKIKRITADMKAVELNMEALGQENTANQQQIADCEKAIMHAKGDFLQAKNILDKAKKWIEEKSVTISNNRKISNCKLRMTSITSIEIPQKKNQVSSLKLEKERNEKNLLMTNALITNIT